MTQERVETAQAIPIEAGPNKVFFQLKPSKAEINIGDKEKRTHPIIRVLLKENGNCLFENIKMRVINCCGETKIVNCQFEEIESCGVPRLKIDGVRFGDDKVLVGNDVVIVCRDIQRNGRVHFRIAVHKDIRVCSEERRQQLAA